jgi:hypothetical protein
MSTYAELKAAVRGYLQRTVTVTDILPGSSTDVDTELDRMILRGANNAVRRAENLCDFAENEVEASVIVPAGQSVSLDRVTDTLTGNEVSMRKVLEGVYSYTTNGQTGSWPVKLMSKKEYQRYKHNLGSVNRVVGVLRNNRLSFEPALDEDVTLTIEGYAAFPRIYEHVIEITALDGGSAYFGEYNSTGIANGKLVYTRYVNGVLLGTFLYTGTEWHFNDADDVTLVSSTEDVASPDLVTVWDDVSFVVEDVQKEHYLIKNAFEYMQWQTLVECNHFLKIFVPRQEGNLAPPEKLADRALGEFIRDEEFRYTGLNS